MRIRPFILAFGVLAIGAEVRAASDGVVALTHARVIDGTGDPVKSQQTIVIENGTITSVSTSPPPAGARVIDLDGRTVMPGFVGMHEHLFYQFGGGANTQMVLAGSAFAKLYLAAGVTTIRTAGTADFDGDLRLKQRIDAGSEPGPTVYVTSPYLDAATTEPDPDRFTRQVAQYADAGATSFKAYTSLRSSELKAAIDAAHSRGLRVTGHLCAVGFHEATALGIDNLEHGFVFDTEFYSGKERDRCPEQYAVFQEAIRMDGSDSRVRQLIADLVRHGVAITSTLAVIESFTAREAAFDPRTRTMLAPRLREAYDAAGELWKDPNGPGPRIWSAVLRREMDFERAFVAAGGKLMAGADPTGWGGALAGFADQRGLELLVDAGLTPEAAVKVATANGARFIGDSSIGTVAPGKKADLVVVRGDPSRNMADVRNVERVFKGGVEHDPAALLASAEGSVGAFQFTQLLTWPVKSVLAIIVGLFTLRALGGRRPRLAAAAGRS